MRDPDLFASLRVTSKPVYHYTDAAGLLGILQNGVLWASEASGMNDRAEVRQGWKKIQDWLWTRPDSEAVELMHTLASRPTEERSEVFVLSASTSADDANQWRLYANGGSGYAIEFDPRPSFIVLHSDASAPEQKDLDEVRRAVGFTGMAATEPWRHVLYDESKIQALLSTVEENIARVLVEVAALDESEQEDARQSVELVLNDWLATIAHLVKEPGFSGENEVRLVASLLWGNECVKFRPGKYGVVRFTELGVRPKNQSPIRVMHKNKAGALPVTSVRVGPLFGGEQVPTVQALLASCGLSGVEVAQSTVPLR